MHAFLEGGFYGKGTNPGEASLTGHTDERGFKPPRNRNVSYIRVNKNDLIKRLSMNPSQESSWKITAIDKNSPLQRYYKIYLDVNQ